MVVVLVFCVGAFVIGTVAQAQISSPKSPAPKKAGVSLTPPGQRQVNPLGSAVTPPVSAESSPDVQQVPVQARDLNPLLSSGFGASNDGAASLGVAISGGAIANTAGGVGPLFSLDVTSESVYNTGFYEGGFFPHLEFSIQAFPGVSPLYLFSLGSVFLTNLSGTNSNGLRNALIHGYRSIFRSSAVFLEGNFLGLIPYYVSGFRWRQRWGEVDLQWTPFEFLRATRDLMSFASTQVSGRIGVTLVGRHLIGGAAKLGLLYAGYDGLDRNASVGFVYGLDADYGFKITKRFQIGARIGIEGALSSQRLISTGLTSGWSVFGFQSLLFALREF